MNRRWPIVGAMLLAYSAAASAASFEVTSGQGSMNRGLGFQPVTGTVAVQTGATIHVPAGATGYVVYNNGCRVPVTPGAFVRVQKVSPCDLPAQGAVASQFGGQQNCDPNNSLFGCADPFTLGLTTLIGGGLLTAGIIAANRSNSNPYYIPPFVSP